MLVECVRTFHINAVTRIDFDHIYVGHMSFGPMAAVGEAFFFDATQSSKGLGFAAAISRTLVKDL